MQDEGVDGSSHGDQSTRVMGGGHVLDCVPLHKLALELEPELAEGLNYLVVIHFVWWD
jgi:hypothetical protein